MMVGTNSSVIQMTETVKGTSKNPNSVAMLRCSINFNAYVSKYRLRGLSFAPRLAWDFEFLGMP